MHTGQTGPPDLKVWKGSPALTGKKTRVQAAEGIELSKSREPLGSTKQGKDAARPFRAGHRVSRISRLCGIFRGI